ncbi:hypothetical protein [Phenylobacterium sp.]|jgi:hypothetical protein|uniref:hypothetical protein n=1 Tax=Phenylobacterium sp. TaxID=1871053 RepID=UPI002F9438CA
MRKWMTALAAAGAAAAIASPAAAQAGRSVAGANCINPPRLDCPQANCATEARTAKGNAVEPKTGRPFYLDFPCDLKPGEKVTFILNLHGMGSVGNWQRHYFPAIDFKEKHRLVIATPTAATEQPQRRWVGEADDAYLQNISDLVIREFGRSNIKAYWLVGHSQGGMTSRRIVCSDYFKDKVDGFVSLSGGRINPPNAPPGTLNARPAGTPAPAAPAAGPPQSQPLPACDFSFIFAVGELEVANGIAAGSPWAEKYRCGPRRAARLVVDEKPGYVTATDQSRGPSWGRFARPGKAQVMVYPGCGDGRVVADVVRLDKGHTEGLEPKIMDAILTLMGQARGGKLQRGG